MKQSDVLVGRHLVGKHTNPNILFFGVDAAESSVSSKSGGRRKGGEEKESHVGYIPNTHTPIYSCTHIHTHTSTSIYPCGA